MPSIVMIQQLLFLVFIVFCDSLRQQQHKYLTFYTSYSGSNKKFLSQSYFSFHSSSSSPLFMNEYMKDNSNWDKYNVQNLPTNTKWREFKLPRSYLQVYVLEAIDMEVRSIDSIQAAIDKDLDIFNMVI